MSQQFDLSRWRFSSRSRSSRSLTAAALSLALFAGACSGGEPEELGQNEPSTAPAEEFLVPETLAFADGPQTLRVSVPSLSYTAPYSVVESNAAQVLIADLLTDGLTRRNPSTGAIEPAIAESYESAADGLVWTFRIGDATYSDGSQIVAADVVASLNRVAALGDASISGFGLWPVAGWADAGAGNPVAGLRATSEDTVEFELTEPFAALPEVLSGVTFGILPAGVSSLVTVEGELPLGSSVDFTPSEIWEDGLRLTGLVEDANITTIELLLDPELTMLQAGESDMAVAIDRNLVLDGLTTIDIPHAANTYFALNSSIAPLDDPIIRQAIVHAIDTEDLRSRFFPNTAPMTGFIPEQVAGGVADACGENCEFDPAQAETLVQASPNSDQRITIDYIDRGEQSIDQLVAEAIAEMLTEVGLDAGAFGRFPQAFPARLVNGELSMFRFGTASTTMSAESSVGSSFHSEGSDNVTATAIDRVDALIDEARATQDADARADLYTSVESILFAEAVVVPFAQFQHGVAFGDTLTAVGLEPDGSLDLAAIEFRNPEEVPLDGE